jgi:hypothetical protein
MMPFWLFLSLARPDHDTVQQLLQQERYTAAIAYVEDFPDPDYHYAMCLIYGTWGDGEVALYHCQQVEVDEERDFFHYLYAEALAYYRLREYETARESIAEARQIANGWRLDFLEAIMNDGDLSGIYVPPWEQKEARRMIPILMFGGLDNS